MKKGTKPQWPVITLAVAVMLAAWGGAVQAQTWGDAGAVFIRGPDMIEEKIEHMAAVLPDGKMLVFGGRIQANNSELWDPATNKFTYKRMNYDHAYGPALAKLADGRYLIAGGNDTDTAEIYDPRQHTFTPTAGKMANEHGFCGAATLTDGKVLVVGSWTGGAPGALFHPATRTFTATQALKSPRSAPVIAPTEDNQAVVLGGVPQDNAKGTPVELYNPASNSFSILQAELFPGESGWFTYGHYEALSRGVHTQRLNDGRYLFAAGRLSGSYLEMMLFTFNPATKAIAKFPVTPPWPATFLDADDNLCQPLVDRAAGKAYLLIPLAGYPSPQRYRLYTVDLATGLRNNPTGFLNTANWLNQFASKAVLPDGRIFVTGGLKPVGAYNEPQKMTRFICPPGSPGGQAGTAAAILELLWD